MKQETEAIVVEFENEEDQFVLAADEEDTTIYRDFFRH